MNLSETMDELAQPGRQIHTDSRGERVVRWLQTAGFLVGDIKPSELLYIAHKINEHVVVAIRKDRKHEQ